MFPQCFWYCASTSLSSLCLSVLAKLSCSVNRNQFTVLRASTCQFLIQNLKFLKVLKITSCLGWYGHHQVLKSSGANCCCSAVVTCVPLMCTCVLLGVSCSLLFFVACFVLVQGYDVGLSFKFELWCPQYTYCIHSLYLVKPLYVCFSFRKFCIPTDVKI
jgi:hypothetical protein